MSGVTPAPEGHATVPDPDAPVGRAVVTARPTGLLRRPALGPGSGGPARPEGQVRPAGSGSCTASGEVAGEGTAASRGSAGARRAETQAATGSV